MKSKRIAENNRLWYFSMQKCKTSSVCLGYKKLIWFYCFIIFIALLFLWLFIVNCNICRIAVHFCRVAHNFFVFAKRCKYAREEAEILAAKLSLVRCCSHGYYPLLQKNLCFRKSYLQSYQFENDGAEILWRKFRSASGRPVMIRQRSQWVFSDNQALASPDEALEIWHVDNVRMFP